MKISGLFGAGLVVLQIALLGLFVPFLQGDSISWSRLSRYQSSCLINEGSYFPNIATYNTGGKRVQLFRQGHAATLIFSGCDCKVNRIKSLIEPAVHRGEDVAFVIEKQPSQLGSFQKQYNLPLQPVAVRMSEINTFIPIETLPAIVHISSEGMVVSIEH